MTSSLSNRVNNLVEGIRNTRTAITFLNEQTLKIIQWNRNVCIVTRIILKSLVKI